MFIKLDVYQTPASMLISETAIHTAVHIEVPPLSPTDTDLLAPAIHQPSK